jgi:hypothetical protein
MQNLMPCDFAGAMRQLDRTEAREGSADFVRERVYREERGAFLVACNDCALKLPRSGQTPWDVVFEDLLYLDNPGNWTKRRALFDVLLTTEAGRAWLAERATEYATQQADEAADEVGE